MKLAVLKGFELVDKCYDRIELTVSDSEDEDLTMNFVLRAKDPYLCRPLPYVIGSEDWHKKWHVGLLESSSESDDDKESDKYSDNDSEIDLPIADRSVVSTYVCVFRLLN